MPDAAETITEGDTLNEDQHVTPACLKISTPYAFGTEGRQFMLRTVSADRDAFDSKACIPEGGPATRCGAHTRFTDCSASRAGAPSVASMG
jgi:hypothetical protein